MFKKKGENQIEKELEELQNARDSICNSRKTLDEIAKVYEAMQKDMIKAIKENQIRLTIHAKAMLEVNDRLKTLEQKNAFDDVMIA